MPVLGRGGSIFVFTVNFVRKICRRAHSGMSSLMRGAAGIRYRVCVWVILFANTFVYMHGACIYVRTFVHVVVREWGQNFIHAYFNMKVNSMHI